jgi:hypothetical protein
VGYSKEAWDDLNDELAAPEPMRPIRLPYVTLTTERQLIERTCSLLGVVCVEVGRQYYALGESDSERINVEARQELIAEGKTEPSEYEVALRIERIMTRLLIAQKVSSQIVAQNLRAAADEILAAKGVEIRARAMQKIAEHEAA